MYNLREVFNRALQEKASDIHLKAGKSPVFRLNGTLKTVDTFPRLLPEDTEEILKHIIPEHLKKIFDEKYEADFSVGFKKLGRFRVNAYKQRGTIALSLRSIPFEVPDIDSLNLPSIIKKLALENRGLILITGTTGSGKSTTLASMINYINERKSVNIITIEDPIEYLLSDKKSIISQRELGTDTTSFSLSLRQSLRQDPDIILVGEMRDVETVETALMAAETGHLVLSTLHTLDAPETINRIVSLFPPYHQNNIRYQLSSVLKAIVSQRLMPKAGGGGRIPAVEIMVNTEAVKECIVDNTKIKRIKDYIEDGKNIYGSQTFDQSIFEHYKKGLVTFEEAIKWVTSPDNFQLKVSGIVSYNNKDG
ncbi:MAG: PilT/PilU family type 4a pilus ATPase [Deferribacterota bacterium]|nr:PilT/PilU family type 4a pilus ATPase [Deferribacterota bacterium]